MAWEIAIRAAPPRGKLAADHIADLPFHSSFRRFAEFSTFPSREETHIRTPPFSRPTSPLGLRRSHVTRMKQSSCVLASNESGAAAATRVIHRCRAGAYSATFRYLNGCRRSRGVNVSSVNEFWHSDT